MVNTVTIYKNVFDKTPYYISVQEALTRIKDGASYQQIQDLRSTIDNDRQDLLKKNLPAVSFSGQFSARGDKFLQKHSGYIVLDFDHVNDTEAKKNELMSHPFMLAAWVSPRNNGVKSLVKIADPSQHSGHFDAIAEIFPDLDMKSRNLERLCFESYDPNILVNVNCVPFTRVVQKKKEEINVSVTDDRDIFDKLKRWMANKGLAFVSGERNDFIFKLAGACSRFGLSEDSCVSLCIQNFAVGQDSFSVGECRTAVRSAYKITKHEFGTAVFENSMLIDKKTSLEVEITQEMVNPDIKPKDVIYVSDVMEDLLNFYQNGYERIISIGVDHIDRHFKMKEGEITLLTGYGNYGKSNIMKWYLLMRMLIFDEKFAFFSPEDMAQDFYNDLIEMLLGQDCAKGAANGVGKDLYLAAAEWLDKRVFFVYPAELSPKPEYIKKRFLELIIKENVKGVVIDPFNQMDNDYSGSGGRDKYLEMFLGDFSRFCKQNMIYGVIVAHPRKPEGKAADGNYRCPDVYDVADGAMWNNKMDNILVYHRPDHQTNPDSDVCEFHAKKIRRQKVVGRKGFSSFNYSRSKRRYIFDGIDPMQRVLDSKDLSFHKSIGVQKELDLSFNNFNLNNIEQSPF